jgi:hypothetical protein
MKAVKLHINFGGLARLRPVGRAAWSLYWSSDFGDAGIIVVWPDTVEVVLVSKRAQWRHVIIDINGAARTEPLDKPSLLDLLRFTTVISC